MDLFFFNTAAPVQKGKYASTNGITAVRDNVCTIYIGDIENAKDEITRKRLLEWNELKNGEVLVVVDWAPFGTPLRKALPIHAVLTNVDGVVCYGGNEVELDGELIKVHDRVESWSDYYALSR